MKIKVFADTICGWCFIGQTRLNKALKAFPETKFEIEHVPFQLNTDMPKEGIERNKYLEIKFGGKEFAQPMYDRMMEEANKENLNFNLDKIKKLCIKKMRLWPSMLNLFTMVIGTQKQDLNCKKLSTLKRIK